MFYSWMVRLFLDLSERQPRLVEPRHCVSVRLEVFKLVPSNYKYYFENHLFPYT